MRPIVKIMIKAIYIAIDGQDVIDRASIVNGNKIKISTSKTANTRATIKKWREKDMRDSFKVGNPHSKGLCRSRSEEIFFLRSFPARPKTEDKTNTKAIAVIIILIIF